MAERIDPEPAAVTARWMAAYDKAEAQCRANIEAWSGDVGADDHVRRLQCVAERIARDYQMARLATDARQILTANADLLAACKALLDAADRGERSFNHAAAMARAAIARAEEGEPMTPDEAPPREDQP